MARSAHGVGRLAALAAAAGIAMAAAPAARAASSEAAFACPPLPAPGYCGDDGPALLAGLGTPADVAVRRDGGYLVADTTNNAIRAVEAGLITTVAGAGIRRGSRRRRACTWRSPAAWRRSATAACWSPTPAGTGCSRSTRAGACDGRGRAGPADVGRAQPRGVLVADAGSNRILLIRPAGRSPRSLARERRAPRATAVPRWRLAGPAGARARRARRRLRRGDCRRARAALDRGGRIEYVAGPFGGAPAIAFGPDGLLRLADPATRRIVRLDAGGGSTTLVRSTRCSAEPALRHPAALAVTRSGDLLIADSAARRILLARDSRVVTAAGAGLRVGRGCADEPARAKLLAQDAPSAGSPDRTTGRPARRGRRASAAGVIRGCAPRSQWRFTIRFLYIRQRGRVVRRPTSRRGFRLYLYVGAQARLVLQARRAGRLRWRYPRRGSSPPRGGRVRIDAKRLRRGRYRLAVQAQSRSLNQRICRTFTLRVRR